MIVPSDINRFWESERHFPTERQLLREMPLEGLCTVLQDVKYLHVDSARAGKTRHSSSDDLSECRYTH